MTARNQNRCRNPASRQRGAALLVSLIMLLVMTVLAVTATRTTTLQERMAGNLRNKSLAFEAAETTLRVGEVWVEDQVGGERPLAIAPSSCGSPPCDVLTNGSLDPMASGTWNPGTHVRTGPSIEGTAQDPQFFIEQQQAVRDALNIGQAVDQSARLYYRVTARSVGGNTTAVSLLRSTYAARF